METNQKWESPSPSGDPWYDVPENVNMLMEDIKASEKPGARELVFHNTKEMEDYFNKLLNDTDTSSEHKRQ